MENQGQNQSVRGRRGRTVFRVLRAALVGALLSMVMLAVLAATVADRLIHHPLPLPSNYKQSIPSHWDANPVNFTTIDKVTLHGLWVRSQGASSEDEAEPQAVLFLNGNAGNISHRLAYVEHLLPLGVSVLLFDYRGYGGSGGFPHEAGLHLDALAAWGWLTEEAGVNPRNIVLYGESLGTAVAVHLASRVEVGGIVLQCGFPSIGEVASTIMPPLSLPAGWILRNRYRSYDLIKTLTVPKLHFHGEVDEVVPVRLGRLLYEAAAPPSRMVVWPELTHNIWPGPRAADWHREMQSFLSSLQSG